MSDSWREDGAADTAKAGGRAQARPDCAQRGGADGRLCCSAGWRALTFAGPEIWQQLVRPPVLTLGHLHDTTLTATSLQGYGVSGTLVFLKCAGPVVIATMLAGLLAGAIQNRFNTASEALTPNWNRINPVEGFKRVFSAGCSVPTLHCASSNSPSSSR